MSGIGVVFGIQLGIHFGHSLWAFSWAFSLGIQFGHLLVEGVLRNFWSLAMTQLFDLSQLLQSFKIEQKVEVLKLKICQRLEPAANEVKTQT